MAVIDRKKLLEAYKEIDLFRAKYRHPDFTPHAWCFHGEKSQGWAGRCYNHRLYVRDGTLRLVNIDAATYKHVSFNLEVPNYWYKRTLIDTNKPQGANINTNDLCNLFLSTPYASDMINNTDGCKCNTQTDGCICDSRGYSEKICYSDIVYCLSDVPICNKDVNICNQNTVNCIVDRCFQEESFCLSDINYINDIPYIDTGTSCKMYTSINANNIVRSSYERVIRPNDYSYVIQFKYTKDSSMFYTTSVEVSTPEKLVYLDMSSDPNWNETIKRIDIAILIKDKKSGSVIYNYDYQPVIYLEYFKVDKINVFEEAKKNPTVVAKDINNLRAKVESLNVGFHNEACNLGDVEGYSKIAGPCGNTDIIEEGSKPLKPLSKPIDWNKPGSSDDRVKSFIQNIKAGDYDSIIYTMPTLPPYNGCSTCDLHTCDCYAVHYGRVECQACNECDQYVPCQAGCDVGCYIEARSCTCDRGCYTEPKSCTCNARCYGYSSCTCYSRYY